MKLTNTSPKTVAVGDTRIFPGETIEIKETHRTQPMIDFYKASGVLTDGEEKAKEEESTAQETPSVETTAKVRKPKGK